jgi:excisionase family DNA binding protein
MIYEVTEMNEEKKVLTVTEVAKELRISRSLAYQQIKKGSIYSLKLGDRYLIPRRAIDDLLSGRDREERTEVRNSGKAA